MYEQKYFATGKRKTSIARVWMEPGDGNFIVNEKTLDNYFGGLSCQIASIMQPLELTECLGKYNICANVMGGGMTGQADAIKHGISKALLEYNIELRPILKKGGFLTRDPRNKERKKYGQPGARKRFQFSKR
jgi:small subunit ribosomal protein S9